MHVYELHQLSQLIVEIGDCFMVRRTMQRLEAKELTLQEAIELLRSSDKISRSRDKTSDVSYSSLFVSWIFSEQIMRTFRPKPLSLVAGN
jgi:hypothetical protein